MTALTLAGGALSLVLFVYLTIALLYPEKLQ
ncbi:MAG TPA: potassium-transporting ATPase subunit F [Polyangiaceae bacterium]|jgi:K+-transporting ATPase KdpF subunit|nr:potassium-transporting ATPase subunit F [Polyangiaceae bacterium]